MHDGPPILSAPSSACDTGFSSLSLSAETPGSNPEYINQVDSKGRSPWKRERPPGLRCKYCRMEAVTQQEPACLAVCLLLKGEAAGRRALVNFFHPSPGLQQAVKLAAEGLLCSQRIPYSVTFPTPNSPSNAFRGKGNYLSSQPALDTFMSHL